MTLKDLYEMIPLGRENRIQAADLAAMWGMSRREAERTREKMGFGNMIVASVGNGYYRPSCEAEFDQYWAYINSYYKKLATKKYHIMQAKKLFLRGLRHA